MHVVWRVWRDEDRTSTISAKRWQLVLDNRVFSSSDYLVAIIMVLLVMVLHGFRVENAESWTILIFSRRISCNFNSFDVVLIDAVAWFFYYKAWDIIIFLLIIFWQINFKHSNIIEVLWSVHFLILRKRCLFEVFVDCFDILGMNVDFFHHFITGFVKGSKDILLIPCNFLCAVEH